MSNLIEGVNKRTRLVGENRLELLLFHLGKEQTYGINVFKVREVVARPPLNRLPHAHPMIRGVTRLRGSTLPAVDLAAALGAPPSPDDDVAFMIVTEFNSTVQGFLVSAVDAIANVNWEQMKAPPRAVERCGYMTAVTEIDGKLVEIIDVERVLSEIRGIDLALQPESDATVSEGVLPVLVVDDSAVARNQVERSLAEAGRGCIMARNGREAIDMLKAWAAEGGADAHIAMVISDIEMPEMDGYTLSQEIRKDPNLAGLYILLHSSLSGGFNQALIGKAGADRLLAKFQPSELVKAVEEHLGKA